MKRKGLLVPHILASVPEKDQCPKNQPDGGHMMKPPALEGEPRRCAYCGAAQSARDALEVMAFNLATGLGGIVEPTNYTRELDRFRAEVEREVRQQIAADFQTYGKGHDTLSWGQAFYIARDGLNGGAR
jgi:hypothetical protein